MNLKAIRQALDSTYPDETKEHLIISILANDKKVIPVILKILEAEREVQKELLSDTNMELSRAFLAVKERNEIKKKYMLELPFVIEEIKKHYIKWKGYIKCNFKIEGLP